jgi:two-component system CheB/CheR fusion protein
MIEIRIDQIFEDIVETIREPLLVLNQDLNVLTANRSFYKVFKVNPEETVGQLIYDLGNKQWNIPRLRELLETILPEKTSFDDYEVKHNFATIGMRTMLLNARKIIRGTGQDRIILLAIEDITERKKAEEDITVAKERHLSLTSILTSVVWTADKEGKFVERQCQWEEFTGQSWEEHKGWGWANAVHPGDRARVEQLWIDAIDNKSTYYSDGRMIRPDGKYSYFEAVATPLLNSDGSIREWVGTVTDITERKQTEDEINKLNEGLEQRIVDRTAELQMVNQELETFSYSVSHDLRAPLRHLTGFSELLQKNARANLDDKARRYLTVISEAAVRIGQLIDDLLAFSRAGRADLRQNPVNLDTMVNEVINELLPETQGRRVLWEIAPLPCVHADATLLRAVLTNLFSNALTTNWKRGLGNGLSICRKPMNNCFMLKK